MLDTIQIKRQKLHDKIEVINTAQYQVKLSLCLQFTGGKQKLCFITSSNKLRYSRGNNVFVALYFQAVSLRHGANGRNVQRHAMVQANSSGTVTTLTPAIQPSTVTKQWQRNGLVDRNHALVSTNCDFIYSYCNFSSTLRLESSVSK